MPVGIFLWAPLKSANPVNFTSIEDGIVGFDHLDPLNGIAAVVTLGLSRSMQNYPPEQSSDNPTVSAR
jgi:hypothetical protein